MTRGRRRTAKSKHRVKGEKKRIAYFATAASEGTAIHLISGRASKDRSKAERNDGRRERRRKAGEKAGRKAGEKARRKGGKNIANEVEHSVEIVPKKMRHGIDHSSSRSTTMQVIRRGTDDVVNRAA